jgi:hypothetical protein
MRKRLLSLALASVTGASMIAPNLASAATVLYDSTPVKGTVSIPSYGPEAYSFNRIGNEVILRPHHAPIKKVAVTMVSWACESGDWTAGCVTTPGAKFQTPITLRLYRASTTDPVTGVTTPGKPILSVTKTFNIRYRPTADAPDGQRYIGSDNLPHYGMAQTITFPVNHRLGSDVVWTVEYNTNTSGPSPLHVASPTDSLNVGVSDAGRISHDRFPHSFFWDTRFDGNTGGAPFVLDTLNLDKGHAGEVPAARFSVR